MGHVDLLLRLFLPRQAQLIARVLTSLFVASSLCFLLFNYANEGIYKRIFTKLDSWPVILSVILVISKVILYQCDSNSSFLLQNHQVVQWFSHFIGITCHLHSFSYWFNQEFDPWIPMIQMILCFVSFK